MVETCEHLTKVGVEEKEKREAEVKVFRASHAQACSSSQQQAVQRVRQFEDRKLQVIR